MEGEEGGLMFQYRCEDCGLWMPSWWGRECRRCRNLALEGADSKERWRDGRRVASVEEAPALEIVPK